MSNLEEKSIDSFWFELGVPLAILSKVFGKPIRSVNNNSLYRSVKQTFVNLIRAYKQFLQAEFPARPEVYSYKDLIHEAFYRRVIDKIGFEESVFVQIFKYRPFPRDPYLKLLVAMFDEDQDDEVRGRKIIQLELEQLVLSINRKGNFYADDILYRLHRKIVTKLFDGSWSRSVSDLDKLAIDELLTQLEPIEAQAIQRNFGLKNYKNFRTEAPEIFRLSVTRILDINTQALPKLRQLSSNTRLERIIKQGLSVCYRELGQLLVENFSLKELRPIINPSFNNPFMDKEIRLVGLSIRAVNCLNNMDILRVSDLVKHTEEELLDCKNMGKKSVAEIKDLLAANGLSLAPEKE